MLLLLGALSDDDAAILFACFSLFGLAAFFSRCLGAVACVVGHEAFVGGFFAQAAEAVGNCLGVEAGAWGVGGQCVMMGLNVGLRGLFDSPNAAATASQLGCTFSTARIVSISLASFSAVQSISLWPFGIFG